MADLQSNGNLISVSTKPAAGQCLEVPMTLERSLDLGIGTLDAQRQSSGVLSPIRPLAAAPWGTRLNRQAPLNGGVSFVEPKFFGSRHFHVFPMTIMTAEIEDWRSKASQARLLVPAVIDFAANL
jgi:hypothetical protein